MKLRLVYKLYPYEEVELACVEKARVLGVPASPSRDPAVGCPLPHGLTHGQATPPTPANAPSRNPTSTR